MDSKFKFRSFSSRLFIDKIKERKKQDEQKEEPYIKSRMERKKQLKESKVDIALYRAALSAFVSICITLALIPFAYFLPWQQIVHTLMYLLLASLFLSFFLTSIIIKKQPSSVKMLYALGIWTFSLLLLLFYLFIYIYFRFFLI